VHELSVASAIVDTVLLHAEGRRVTGVTVRTGRLRQVVPASLEFYFEIVARGTGCEGARLHQDLVPAVLRCEACAHDWEIDLAEFRCPKCGATDVVVLSGEEFEVEWIEIEETEEAAACTAPR
jgi:hydrogenase nickel incorporation protein HypA/HybF